MKKKSSFSIIINSIISHNFDNLINKYLMLIGTIYQLKSNYLLLSNQFEVKVDIESYFYNIIFHNIEYCKLYDHHLN